MSKRFFYIYLLLCRCFTVEGCHQSKDQGTDKDEKDKDIHERRKRNATDYNGYNKNDDGNVEDFFAVCLKNKKDANLASLQTAVDYTIRQSSWYEKTDAQYCVGDSVDCWRELINELLASDSQFLPIAKDCVESYGQSKGKYVNIPDSRKGIPSAKTSSLYVSEDAFERELRHQMVKTAADDQSLTDIGFLIKFYKEDVACGLDFCDCAGVTVPAGERCGDNWYTRIAAHTKLGSPVRTAVIKAANFAIGLSINPSSPPPPSQPPPIYQSPPLPASQPPPIYRPPPRSIYPPPNFVRNPVYWCRPLVPPANGRLLCTARYLQNSRCSVNCKYGVAISRPPSVCLCNLGRCYWSSSLSTCRRNDVIKNLILVDVILGILNGTRLPVRAVFP